MYLDVSVLRDVSFVNNTIVIRENPKVTAINSCIEVDLTGQVCADSIGSKLYSSRVFLDIEFAPVSICSTADEPNDPCYEEKVRLILDF